MGKIIVTGASGQFGSAAARTLLEKVPAEDLVLLSRTPGKLAEFAERGAHVRHADFDDPASLLAAMDGGERMLLISTVRVGSRVEQHTAAVEAAVARGVKHVVYTSLLGVRKPGNPSVEGFDHIATERMIEGSGLAWTHLRDSLYAEAVATAMAIPALLAGHKPENSGQGRVPIVSRDDCVATAVGVLTQDGHANTAVDVTGPELWTLPDAMALVSEMAGKPIVIEPVDDDGMYAYFDSLGVPRKASDVIPDGPIPWASEGMVTFGQSIREGFMDVASDDVERITGRKPRTLRSGASSTGARGRNEPVEFAFACLPSPRGERGAPSGAEGEGSAAPAAASRRTPLPTLSPQGERAKRRYGVAIAALLALGACTDATIPQVDTSVIGAGDDWDNPGGDWAGSHFSRLTDITPANVGELGLAWEYDLGTARVQEATPVVIDGVMYTSGNLGRVYALNAATGEALWTFTPEVDMQANRAACCDQANRGVQVHDGRVFVASLDGWLYALNEETGAVEWKTDTIADRKRGYTVTGAPEIAGDLVLIGNGGAEMDTRGYVTAYDIRNGAEAWRFWTIPHDPDDGPQESEALEAALETWDPDSRWDIGGGGTVWDAIQYDPVFDQVIIGVGNGGPYPHKTRSPKGGDNLYLNSLVALDRESGEMKWHFQETPTDSWDLTATQPMVFTELEVGGETRPVILHTPKNGFFFVVDRESGKPLAANALVRTSWASGWNLETGKPVLTPEFSDYSTGPKIVFPASAGARNWHPAAYDPGRNLYFAAVVDIGNLMFIAPGQENPPHRKYFMNPAAALIFTADLAAAAPTLPPPMQAAIKALPQWQWALDEPFSSELRAIDPLTGETKWAADFDGWQDRGGVLATTSGLVIHGTLSGKLIVRDAETGDVLKAIDTGSSILAAPMTYRVDGVQYVAVQTGWGGGGWGFVPAYAAAYSKGNANRLLVFRIGGGEVPVPDDLPALEPAPAPPPQLPGVTPATIAMGSGLFTENCMVCHSNQPRAPLPDLRRMSRPTHAAFDRIVLDGLFVPNGMPRWDDLLSPDQVKAIHAFLIDEQGKVRARELQLQREGKPLDSRSLTILSSF